MTYHVDIPYLPAQQRARKLRDPVGRRTARREIARFVAFGQNVLAFPICEVGVIEGLTRKLPRPAIIFRFDQPHSRRTNAGQSHVIRLHGDAA